jgi:hypothetical protein
VEGWQCECDPANDTCAAGSHCVEGACESCITDDACGSNCQDCTGTTPFCDMAENGGLGGCVQCMDNNDCRDGAAAPFNSPLGLCTPDKTCTCWVDPASAETLACSDSSACPPDYTCAQDLLNKNHFACLRDCTETQDHTPVEGIACELRNTLTAQQAYVWVPMTTCYAFDKFGISCTIHNDCRISSTLNDGACQTINEQDVCTYTCNDGTAHDSWCPYGNTCGLQYCDATNLPPDTDTAL